MDILKIVKTKWFHYQEQPKHKGMENMKQLFLDILEVDGLSSFFAAQASSYM